MNLFITLYIVNFLRTVIIIAIIYFAIRLFTRYVLPLLLEKKVKEMQQKMQEQQKQQRRSGKQEGEVTIEYDKKRNNVSSGNEGEYVDFEEVEWEDAGSGKWEARSRMTDDQWPVSG